MAIKGLTRKLNEAGKVKIGCKGDEITSSKGAQFRPPVRLDHFIITTTEKGADGDFVIDQRLMDELSQSTDSVKNEKNEIVGVPMRLMYDDTDLNFPTRRASYMNGILTCECVDGDNAYKRIDDFKKAYSCPCAKANPDYDKNDKCKPNGKLTMVIDAAGLFGQVHVFRTTSINSIQGIIGGIELIKTATGGKIAGLPLMLMLNNKTTVIPTTGQSTTIQVVSICYRGSMADLQKKCLQIASDHAQFLLSMKTIEDDARLLGLTKVVSEDDEMDFQEEFYPQSVQGHVVDTVDAGSNDVPEADQVENEKAAEKIEQSEETKQPETTTTFNTSDVLDAEQKESAKKSREKADKDVKQLGIMNRAQTCYDRKEALILVQKLDKERLVMFLKNMVGDDDLPPENENKPVFLEEAANLINSDDWVKIVGEYIAKDKAKHGGGQDPVKEPEPAKESDTVKDTVIDQVESKKEPEKSSETMAHHPWILKIAGMKQAEIVWAIRDRYPNGAINPTLPIDDLLKLAEKLLQEEKAAKEAEKQEPVKTKR